MDRRRVRGYRIEKDRGSSRKAHESVEKEFASVQAEVERARQEANPKNEESRLLHEAEVRAAVEAVTVEGVVQRISSLGLDVSKALGGLSEQLREEVGRLAAVREAVKIETRELERLHKLDVAATALDQLVQDYSQKEQELEQEIESQRSREAIE